VKVATIFTVLLCLGNLKSSWLWIDS